MGMNRISLADLRVDIDIALRILPDRVKRGLTMKRTYERDAATQAIADHLVDRLFSRCLILAPSQLRDSHFQGSHGEFGVTEPHPFPELIDWGSSSDDAQLPLLD